MSAQDPLEIDLSERRKAKRQIVHGKVRIAFDTTQIDGEADNFSKTGILFFTEGELRVHVEFEEDGVVRRMQGRLVRCERIQGDRRAWAVEFHSP